jgi:hypothetical protein
LGVFGYFLGALVWSGAGGGIPRKWDSTEGGFAEVALRNWDTSKNPAGTLHNVAQGLYS